MANRGRNRFKEKWVKGTDSNGDQVGSYLTKTGEYTVKCKWCTIEIGVGNMGYAAIKRHFEGKDHIRIGNLRKNRDTSQSVFENPADNDAPVDDEATAMNEQNPESVPKKGLLKYFSHSSVPPDICENNNNGNQIITLGDKVAKAEIFIILQSVFKNYSLSSLDTLVSVLQVALTDSKIASKITLGRTKASYVLTEAIGPYFLKETLKDIKQSETFVLGVDTATTKHLGLSKGLDLKVRYYSETYKKVVDAYISTANLGHETSEILKDVTIQELKEAGLDVTRLLVVSRDNPNVMKGYNRRLTDALTEEGNPKLFESPCTLHPTHTSFKKALEKLSLNVDMLLVDIHGWFKLSTARREDVIDLRIELDLEDEKVNEFFLRHVSTRWLTMKPVTMRVINHWESLTNYFVEYLPNSSEQSHKDAVKSERYQRIIKEFKPSKNKVNLARLRFVVYLSTKSETFLKTLQSEKPLAYKLHTDCCLLVANLMTSVMKPEHVPKTCDSKEFKNIDFETKSLPRHKCDFGPVVAQAILECKEDAHSSVRKEFKEAMIVMIKYLIDHLPLNSNFLRDLSFADPNMLESSDFVPPLLRVATATKRFTNVEVQNLENQLKVLKLRGNFPEFDEARETFDQYWLNKLVRKVKETMGEGEGAQELSRLVKIISIFPNSQAFIERGFNDTKRIADARQSVSENLMKASKVVLDVVRQSGGPEKVFISMELIGAHQSARATYRERLRREDKAKQVELEKQKRLEELENKKRKYEEEKDAWDVKVSRIKDEIKVLKTTMSKHEEQQNNYFEKAEKVKSQIQKTSNYKLARIAAEAMKSLREELDLKQAAMVRLMTKKPKLDM